jgi:hypothetical protein
VAVFDPRTLGELEAVAVVDPGGDAGDGSASLRRVALRGAADRILDVLKDNDRVGAQLIEPAVLLRFAPDGQLRHMRVDVGGLEQLECVREIRAPIPRSVSTTRASLLRCEYRCTVS